MHRRHRSPPSRNPPARPCKEQPHSLTTSAYLWAGQVGHQRYLTSTLGIHRWMTALLQSGRRRVVGAYFPYRLTAAVSSPAFSAQSHLQATPAFTTFLPSIRYVPIPVSPHKCRRYGERHFTGAPIPTQPHMVPPPRAPPATLSLFVGKEPEFSEFNQ